MSWREWEGRKNAGWGHPAYNVLSSHCFQHTVEGNRRLIPFRSAGRPPGQASGLYYPSWSASFSTHPGKTHRREATRHSARLRGVDSTPATNANSAKSIRRNEITTLPPGDGWQLIRQSLSRGPMAYSPHTHQSKKEQSLCQLPQPDLSFDEF
jgi:hypothetical protein